MRAPRSVTEASGEPHRLLRLVSAAYGEADQSLCRVDRSASVMAQELEASVAALRVQNMRFEAALEHMSHGLCMLDAQGCMVVCNRRFREIYGLAEDAAAPGVTLRRVLERGHVFRHVDGDVALEAVLAAHMALTGSRMPGTRQQVLSDACTVIISSQPVSDGGCVQIFEDITQRQHAEARIRHMAHHDALTGLPNRVLFRERLERIAAVSAQTGRVGAVLCLDLDHFKEVNDTLGHAVGDRLLEQVALRVAALLRRSDTFARLGVMNSRSFSMICAVRRTRQSWPRGSSRRSRRRSQSMAMTWSSGSARGSRYAIRKPACRTPKA